MATPTSLPATFVAGNVLTAAQMNDLRGAFRIVAVKHAEFIGTQTNSTAPGGNFAVTNLSITHTLADSANKLIISAYLGAAASGNQLGEVGIAVANDGSLINIGTANSSSARVSAGGRTTQSGDTRVVSSPAITFVYSPGDTSSHTYTVRAINIGGGTATVCINRTEADAGITQDVRATSCFVIQEVSA